MYSSLRYYGFCGRGGERERENINIRSHELRSEIPLESVTFVLMMSWGKWLLVGKFKAEITKEQS